MGIMTLYRRKASDAGWVRRQQARGNAARRLKEAKSFSARGHSAEALRQVRAAIIGLIADLQNRVADGLTAAEVDQCLTHASIAENDRTAIVKLLESIESADYGGAQSIDPQTAIRDAGDWIARVSPRLERGASR